jgi:hypothetical protein
MPFINEQDWQQIVLPTLVRELLRLALIDGTEISQCEFEDEQQLRQFLDDYAPARR